MNSCTLDNKVPASSFLDRLYYGSEDPLRAAFIPGSELYFAKQEHLRKPVRNARKAYDYSITGINEGLRLIAYPTGALLLYEVAKSFGLL
jgi:hypothetical protein